MDINPALEQVIRRIEDALARDDEDFKPVVKHYVELLKSYIDTKVRSRFSIKFRDTHEFYLVFIS